MKIRTSLAVASAALAVAGCSAGTGTATPVASSAAAAATSPAAATVHHVGQALELKSDQSDITVTLVAVKTTATSSDPSMEAPQAGDRYAAAEFRITNNAAGAFQDAPDNSAKAIGSDGTQYDTTIVTGLAGGTVFGGTVNLVAHGSALGWVVFEVPKAAKITGVQYTSDSGFGTTGQWTVG